MIEKPYKNDDEIEKELKIEGATHHSDKEMLLYIALKFLLLLVAIFYFDVLIHLLTHLFSIGVEVVHLLIEFIEEILEALLEKISPTTRHQNEVIIVNTAMLLVVFGVYKLFFSLRFVYRLKRHLKMDWLRYRKRQALNWSFLPLASKVKLVTAYVVGFISVFLLAF